MFGNAENQIIDGCKECTKCHRVLSLELFNKSKQNPSGRRAACKECQYQADKNRIARRRDGDKRDGRARYMFDEHGLKPCSVCGELKAAAGFSPAPLMASGYESRCKACNALRQAMAANGDVSNFLKSLLHGSKTGCRVAKNGTKRGSLEHSITFEDVLEIWNQQHGRCALTGVEMTLLRGSGRVMTNASIDRIDSNGGYTRDNVRLVCLAINQIKGTMTDLEMFDMCRAIVAHHESQQRLAPA